MTVPTPEELASLFAGLRDIKGFVEYESMDASEIDGAITLITNLRQMLADAPHVNGCRHVDWDADGLLRLGECTCWKAGL